MGDACAGAGDVAAGAKAEGDGGIRAGRASVLAATNLRGGVGIGRVRQGVESPPGASRLSPALISGVSARIPPSVPRLPAATMSA